MDEAERGERNKNLRQFITKSRSKATQRKTDAYGYRFQEFVRQSAEQVSNFIVRFISSRLVYHRIYFLIILLFVFSLSILGTIVHLFHISN